LKLIQPLVDVSQGCVVFMAYDSFDVALKDGKEGVLVAECLIDSGNEHLLNGAFEYRAGITELAGIFQSADAAPNDRLFASVVPMNPAEKFAATSAYNHI